MWTQVGERIKINFCPTIVNELFKFCDLSLIVTSEIKCTNQYCYNNERKTRSLTFCQFYLITKRQQCCNRIQLQRKMYNVCIYIKIFQSTLDTSLRDLHYKIVIGSGHNKHSPRYLSCTLYHSYAPL